MGPGLGFWNLRAYLKWTTFSNKAMAPFLMIKHSNIWAYEDHFLFKPPHTNSWPSQPCSHIMHDAKLHSVQPQKSPESITVSTVFKTPKFQVSSETHGNLLSPPIKSESKSRSQVSSIQWHKIYYHCKRIIVRNTGPRQDQTPVRQTRLSMCLISKHSLARQTLSDLLAATHFSPGPVLQSVSSSPWQVSHDSEILNILGSPTKSRLHLHSFIQWLLRTSM